VPLSLSMPIFFLHFLVNLKEKLQASIKQQALSGCPCLLVA
jgi:hypothetical protein